VDGARAVTLSSLVFSGMVLVVIGRSFPPAVLFLDWLLCPALVGGVRLAIPALRKIERSVSPPQDGRTLWEAFLALRHCDILNVAGRGG
jgi:hypothetical protein